MRIWRKKTYVGSIRNRSELGLQEAPWDWRVVQEMRFALLGWRDPGARFLRATALAYDLTLITADERRLSVTNGQ